MLQIALAGAWQDIHAIHTPQCPPWVSLWAGLPAAVASWGPRPMVTQASLLPTQLCSVRGARCMRPVAPRAPPHATTTVPSLGGPAGLSPVWRAASALRGLCCMVCRVRVGRGEGALGRGGAEGPQGDGVPLWLEPCRLCPQEVSAWSRLSAPVSGGAASSRRARYCRRTVATGERGRRGVPPCPGLAKPGTAADPWTPCPQHVPGKSVALWRQRRPLCRTRAWLCGGRDPLPGERALCAPQVAL